MDQETQKRIKRRAELQRFSQCPLLYDHKKIRTELEELNRLTNGDPHVKMSDTKKVGSDDKRKDDRRTGRDALDGKAKSRRTKSGCGDRYIRNVPSKRK